MCLCFNEAQESQADYFWPRVIDPHCSFASHLQKLFDLSILLGLKGSTIGGKFHPQLDKKGSNQKIVAIKIAFCNSHTRVTPLLLPDPLSPLRLPPEPSGRWSLLFSHCFMHKARPILGTCKSAGMPRSGRSLRFTLSYLPAHRTAGVQVQLSFGHLRVWEAGSHL